MRDFFFVGRLCADFLLTGGVLGWRVQFESLKRPRDLTEWLMECSLGLPPLPVAPATFRDALQLREAMWECVDASLRRERVPVSHAGTLNRFAAAPRLSKQLAREGWSWHRPSVSRALATIAHDVVELLGDPEQRTRLRQCANPDCRIVFFDESRPGTRRWCLPNRCGDRLRARAYRVRHHA
jgi:predicted RNA-binding Zn ribbon-like protein